MRVLLIAAAIVLVAVPAVAAEFVDMPRDHWAAEAVNELAKAGVIEGYPDGTFRGNKTVTRYELAVALERMIYFIRESRKPVLPAKKLSLTPWTDRARRSVKMLASGGFIEPRSNLTTDGLRPITHELLAESIASVAVRLIELDVPGWKAE